MGGRDCKEEGLERIIKEKRLDGGRQEVGEGRHFVPMD